MNDLVVQYVVAIPVVIRHAVFATANSIRGFDFSLFSAPLWRLVYWSEDARTRGAKNPPTLDRRCSVCFAWFTKSSLKALIEILMRRPVDRHRLDSPPKIAASSAVSNDRASCRRCPGFGEQCQKGL
jgi:hypothetical protein